MKLDVSPSDILDAFAPAIRREVTGDDAAWDAAVARMSKPVPWWHKLLGRARKEEIRDPGAVQKSYEKRWGSEQQLATRLDLSLGKGEPVVWNDRRYFALPRGTKRVHLLYLMRLIEKLQPKTVLEVGFGTGQNLFILRARFPEIEFTGIELTEGGYRAAEAVRSQPALPQDMVEFSPLPPRDLSAHQAVVLQIGSVTDLAFPDRSFDLVFTVQALEQMESIRARALSEIARVCAGHVAMLEPFADWNMTEVRSRKVKSSGFFSARIADLPGCGLQPVFATDDMPAKVVYAIGLVVAEPIQTPARA